MPDHDAAVAAVLELVMQKHLPIQLPENDAKHSGWVMCMCHGFEPDAGPNLTLFEGPVFYRRHVAEKQKEALTAAGIRCLYVPKGVAVEHGARLVDTEYSGHRWPNGRFGRIHDRNSVHMDGCISFYAIEATP